MTPMERRRNWTPLAELRDRTAAKSGGPELIVIGCSLGGMNALQVVPVEGLPEVREGDDVAALIADAVELDDGDVLVVAHKIVSKAEGRVVRLDDLEPSKRARELAGADDPRQVEAILREAVRIVRVRGSLVIAQTGHGFVCASAGVDASNATETGTVYGTKAWKADASAAVPAATDTATVRT